MPDSTYNIQEIPIRSAAILTLAYVAGTVINIRGANQLVLNAFFTQGSSTGCRVKLEFSEDGTTWTQETSYTLVSGVQYHTLTEHDVPASVGGVGAAIPIPISHTWLKVSAKALTDVTNTSLSLSVIRGYN